MVAHIIGNSEAGIMSLVDGSNKELLGPGSINKGSCLIPGLPDDLASLCLSRVPSWHHSLSRVVCKNWNSFLKSEELLSIRQSNSVAESWLYVFCSDPSVSPGQAYNPVTNKWRNIALMPTDPFTYGLSNYVIATVEHEIFIIGGVLFDTRSYPSDVPVASKKVYKYDALRNTWKRMADMHEARGNFACGVIDKKNIIVAGGSNRHSHFKRGGNRMVSAEVYNIGTDTWEKIADMNRIRASCTGFVVKDDTDVKFLAMGGYGESHTVDGVVSIDDYYRDGESFGLSSGKWTNIGNMWHHSEGWRLGPVAKLGQEIFTLQGNSLLSYDFGTNTWRTEIFPLPERLKHDMYFFGFNGELYMVPMERFPSFMRQQTPSQKYDPSAKRWSKDSAFGSHTLKFGDIFETAEIRY